ncbi:kinase-like domain-containing protein [Powellomyces hirtus]|nr:kinase-like domain-containing protein [Powellomyces hirtus]
MLSHLSPVTIVEEISAFISRDDEFPSGILDNYDVSSQLGRGAFGAVFKATSTRKGKKEVVAVKRTDQQDQQIDLGLEGFLPADVVRELGHLSILRHQNVIEIKQTVIDETPEKCRAFLVLEFCPNNLHRYLVKHEKLPMKTTRTFLRQILEGLNYCHTNRVFHRDLKPENILLTKDNQVKIADFGLSRVIACPSKCLSPVTTTLSYRAPELMMGEHYTYSYEVDIWSVGCIFAEMIRGALLFPGQSEVQMVIDMERWLGSPEPGDFPLCHEWLRVRKGRATAACGLELALVMKEDKAEDKEVLSLAREMLKYNTVGRIRAAAALEHPFFDTFSDSDADDSDARAEPLADVSLTSERQLSSRGNSAYPTPISRCAD